MKAGRAYRTLGEVCDIIGSGTPAKGDEHFYQNGTIPWPKLADATRIIEKLLTMSEKTQHLESIYQQKLADLDELKKSLLHQAFTGAL